MAQFKGATVLITGGASGIGKLMGEQALKKGAKLIIWDINQTAIDLVVADFEGLGEVSGYRVDVSDHAGIRDAASELLQRHSRVDILINNAGVVVGKYFHEHSESDIVRTMEINAFAPMLVTLQFLPGMIERNSGHICTIASSAGLISNPKMSVYAASKWSALGWSDSLRLEMTQLRRSIGVTTVTPYYINTGMFDGVRSVVPILKPEKVARKVIRAIEKNRIILSMPWSMRFVRFFQGLLPIWFFDWFVGKVMGIYHTMEYFKGHSK